MFLLVLAPPLDRKKWQPRKMGLAWLMLAGLLSFCDGCHGDEDNELFARLASPSRAGLAQTGLTREASEMQPVRNEGLPSEAVRARGDSSGLSADVR